MRKLFLLIALLLSVTVTQAQGIDLDRIQRATVYIIQTRQVAGQPVITCVGSGTIVDRSGLIVANAHNTVTNRDCDGDQITIALSVRPGEPPVPTYYAEVAQANIGLDLAILRITQELNGRLVEPGTLSLPFVEVIDSNGVQLDDTITVVGYPGVFNDPVGIVRGTVTGFVGEPSGGDRSWFKTDAPIPGTMTGGGVYNQQGQLIAIPTTVPIVPLIADASCPQLGDTNNDGAITRTDDCVPIGGFINALRPTNFARPLLRGASLGLTVEKISEPPATTELNDEEPSFGEPFFSPSVVEGLPTTLLASLPTGSTSLFMFFEYRNMTPDTIYELRVTINDRPNATFGLAPVRWSGGENGLWYIGTTGQPLPTGTYEFTLFINGIASSRTRVTVGAQSIEAQSRPAFSNISFGIAEGDQLFGRGNVLPAGGVANARFIHRNVAPGTEWAAVWYYNGEQLTDPITQPWEERAFDTHSISVANQDNTPLPPGQYRLELYLSGESGFRLSTMGEFVIAGAAEGAFPRVFSPPRFNAAQSTREALEAPAQSTFTSGIPELYAVFNWELLAAGTLYTMRWRVDGTIFYEETVPWRNAQNGGGFITRLSAPGGLPDGTYTIELLIRDTLLAQAEAEVGIGQLPIDPFADASGVQLNGRIVDAETQEGIPGVSFIMLTEDWSVADFIWDQEQVFAIAVTDRNGNFQIDRPLAFDAPYSVIIQADGYVPINADGVLVDDETENPLDVVIALTRD